MSHAQLVVPSGASGGECKVSVVVSSYNRAPLLAQTLASIFEQEGPVETIVVDDQSDQPEAIADLVFQAVVPKGHELRLVVSDGPKPTTAERMKTNRLGRCLNLGLAEATGELVVYTTDDDYLLPGWFGALREAFRESSLQIAYGQLYHSGDLGRRKTFDECMKENNSCRWFETVPDPYGKLDHNQVAHRRELLKKLKYPWWPEGDECRCGVDAFFFRRLRSVAEFHGLPVPCAVKRFHSTNFQTIYTR